MRKPIAVLWLAVPPLLLSALVHSIDPDVGGIRGLASRPVLISVMILGAPLIALAGADLRLALLFGWRCALGFSFLPATLAAVTLALLQTPHPEGIFGYARTVGGVAGVVWLFLAAAVIPAMFLGWPQKRQERHHWA